MTASLDDVATNGRLAIQAIYSIQQAILSTFPRVYGSFTLSASSTTTVSNSSVVAGSIVIPFPTNAAAAALMGSAKALYQSATVAGTSFSMTTGDGTAAAGTETFNYIVINPA